MIQHYELMYILPGSLELEQVPAHKAAVAEMVKAAGATITVELDMERRRLAYKMGQESYGYYHVMQFDAEASAIKPLDAKIRLENAVMRFMIVKATPMTADQLKEMIAGEKYKKQRPQPAAAVAAKVEQTSATALTEAEMAFAKSASSKRAEEVVEEDKKVSIEELDKKLDAILEDTDLDKKL
jgi:small subunit ribosomal protein S6